MEEKHERIMRSILDRLESKEEIKVNDQETEIHIPKNQNYITVADPELKAMQVCLFVLEQLDSEQRGRVLDWVCAKLDVEGYSEE